MVHIHLMQQWFGLSDPAMGEAIYDVPLYREFAGLDGGKMRLPEESTILRFCHLREAHSLAKQILAVVKEILCEKGLSLKAKHDKTPNQCGASTAFCMRRSDVKPGQLSANLFGKTIASTSRIRKARVCKVF